MTCVEAQELIEAVAAGDVPPPVFAAHVSGCRDCAAALAAAVRIERALAGRAAPAAPVNFSQTVMAAIRRQHWQYEEHVDRAFNVTMAMGVALVVIALGSLLNASAMAQMVLLAVDTISEIPRQPAPWPAAGSLPTAALTAAVLAMAVGIWWWAERRSDFQDG